jgi:hypothetical protein
MGDIAKGLLLLGLFYSKIDKTDVFWEDTRYVPHNIAAVTFWHKLASVNGNTTQRLAKIAVLSRVETIAISTIFLAICLSIHFLKYGF